MIFTDTDSAVREHPDLLREYFGTIIPSTDNKFAALNSAVWSGGSFIYVPKGVKIEFPAASLFPHQRREHGPVRTNVDHRRRRCSSSLRRRLHRSDVHVTSSLHSAVVEIICKRGSRCRYTTIQNWANNIYNLVTKRAVAYADATMEWVDGNLGSKLTMKYPAVYMMEPGARGEILSIAFACQGPASRCGCQAGSLRSAHNWPDHQQVDFQRWWTQQLSRLGASRERVPRNHRCNVVCDALILDPQSPKRYLSLHRDPRTRRDASATKPAFRASAKSNCFT